MFDVDIIIPCYGNSKKINKGLASLATSWKSDYIHITMVNDCSPNTDNNYQDLVDYYRKTYNLDIQCIKTPQNWGQGLTRQYGIDHTHRDWFLFMDEDDMYLPLAISQLVGSAETWGKQRQQNPYKDYGDPRQAELPDEIFVTDEQGNLVDIPDHPKCALVSAPLFEFDDNHTHIIPANNGIWLNSKLYNRKFIEKHNIKFNEAQSRHAEDYYWMNCFFFCLQNDPEYEMALMSDEGMFYLWYPNEESQSRIDPHYGHMLSGYTMNGSCNILKFYQDTKIHGIKWTEEIQEQWLNRLINSTMYSYITFLSFIKHVAMTDYVPKLEKDWTLLRDSCKWLRDEVKKNWSKFNYIQCIEELYRCKNMSDVQYTEPWVSFEDYILNGVPYFNWSFKDLMKAKETMRFVDPYEGRILTYEETQEQLKYEKEAREKEKEEQNALLKMRQKKKNKKRRTV